MATFAPRNFRDQRCPTQERWQWQSQSPNNPLLIEPTNTGRQDIDLLAARQDRQEAAGASVASRDFAKSA
jgi:hypothetical protein